MKPLLLLSSAVYNALITIVVFILFIVSDHTVQTSEIKNYSIFLSQKELVYSNFIFLHLGVLLLLMVLSVIFNILWNTRCKKILPEKKYALYQRINFFLSVFPFMLPLVIYPLMAVLLQK